MEAVKHFGAMLSAPRQKPYYYKQYEEHIGEEGWYVYFRPSDPRVRAICEGGPMSKSAAESLYERLVATNKDVW